MAMDRYRLSPKYQGYSRVIMENELSNENAFNKRIAELKREEQFCNSEHVQNQRAVHRDLMNIRAAKGRQLSNYVCFGTVLSGD